MRERGIIGRGYVKEGEWDWLGVAEKGAKKKREWKASKEVKDKEIERKELSSLCLRQGAQDGKVGSRERKRRNGFWIKEGGEKMRREMRRE